MVRLYHGTTTRTRLKGVREVVDRYQDGAWQVLVHIVLDDSSLNIENLFQCEMALPHTNYRLSRSTIYSPSKFLIANEKLGCCNDKITRVSSELQ